MGLISFEGVLARFRAHFCSLRDFETITMGFADPETKGSETGTWAISEDNL